MSWRNILLVFALLTLFVQQVGAQFWYGFSSMNRAGINELHIQPASSVRQPYLYDIQIAGIESYSITPEYFPLSIRLLKEDPAFFLAENHQQVVGETLAFPSFVWKVDNKNAVGLDLKLRSVFAIDPLESSFVQLLTDYIFLGQAQSIQSDETLITRSSAWFEAGFNYSRNMIKNEHHEFSIGITPKIIFGQGSANLVVEDANIRQNFSEGTVELTGLVGLQYSSTIDEWKLNEYSFVGRTTVGFSGGVEYIFRKENSDTHTLKAGLSILDVGKMKYDRSIYAGTFRADELSVSAETINQVDILKAWADVVRDLFDKIPEDDENITIELPTKLSLQLDYRIRSNIYVNFSGFLALNANEKDIYQSPNFNTFVLIPRFEKQKWGIALPVYYDSYKGYSTGISFSWGPVFIGVTNIIQSFTSNVNPGGYFGIKFSRMNN